MIQTLRRAWYKSSIRMPHAKTRAQREKSPVIRKKSGENANSRRFFGQPMWFATNESISCSSWWRQGNWSAGCSAYVHSAAETVSMRRLAASSFSRCFDNGTGSPKSGKVSQLCHHCCRTASALSTTNWLKSLRNRPSFSEHGVVCVLLFHGRNRLHLGETFHRFPCTRCL